MAKFFSTGAERATLVGGVSRIFINKWVVLGAIGLILYMTGGFNLIMSNPAMLVFGGLLLFVIVFMGGKQ